MTVLVPLHPQNPYEGRRELTQVDLWPPCVRCAVSVSLTISRTFGCYAGLALFTSSRVPRYNCVHMFCSVLFDFLVFAGLMLFYQIWKHFRCSAFKKYCSLFNPVYFQELWEHNKLPKYICNSPMLSHFQNCFLLFFDGFWCSTSFFSFSDSESIGSFSSYVL